MSTTHQIAESSSQISADLSKIESYISLGDNCEFGFVQRNAGFEPSGLLRWAIAKPIDVVRFLENIYSEGYSKKFYKFDGLKPFGSKMVLEETTNFSFHSSIHSAKNENSGNLEFKNTRNERLELWNIEREKFHHLFNKFVLTLSGTPSTFVIKKLPDTDLELLVRLSELLHEFNDQHSLFVVSVNKEKVGKIEAVNESLTVGYLEFFASYSEANKCDYENWMKILEAKINTCELEK